MQYDWPGNIRELENVIERASILCYGNTIEPRDLSIPGPAMMTPSKGRDTVLGTAISLDEVEHLHIEAVMRSFGGNKTQAATILGISVKTLYTKLQKYQINWT